MNSFLDKIRNDNGYKKINQAFNTSMCLASLGLAQVLKGTIVAAFPDLLSLFFIVQFFGSTVQGSISDIYKRSTVLNTAFGVLIVTISVLVFFHGLEGFFFEVIRLISIVLIGLWGNADVVSRAEMIDIHYHSDRRKIMSWTVFAEAFSWVVVGFLIRFLNFEPINILTICILVAIFLLVFSILFNTDKTEDRKHLHGIYNELKLVVINSKSKFILITALVIVGECAYFFFFYSQENHIKNSSVLADSYMCWFAGMSLGCWILSKIKPISDFIFLILGLVISLVSIIFFVICGMKDITNVEMFYSDSFIYAIAGLGSGFYLPCFYSMISRGQSIHFQGVLTGWIDSLRVFGDAISNTVLLGLVIFPRFLPIAISGILFLMTTIFLLIVRRRTL